MQGKTWVIGVSPPHPKYPKMLFFLVNLHYGKGIECSVSWHEEENRTECLHGARITQLTFSDLYRSLGGRMLLFILQKRKSGLLSLQNLH